MFCDNAVKQQTPVVFVRGEGVLEARTLMMMMLLLLLTGLNDFCRWWKEPIQVQHLTGASAAPRHHASVVCRGNNCTHLTRAKTFQKYPFLAVKKENNQP